MLPNFLLNTFQAANSGLDHESCRSKTSRHKLKAYLVVTMGTRSECGATCEHNPIQEADQFSESDKSSESEQEASCDFYSRTAGGAPSQNCGGGSEIKASPPSVKKQGHCEEPLRRGKWTSEEEVYVERIISDFSTGLLPVAAGTTLRSYLSDKLHCDPMRITKKFTGASSIGKRVFRPVALATSGPGSGSGSEFVSDGYTAAIVAQAHSELLALEAAFRMKLVEQQSECESNKGPQFEKSKKGHFGAASSAGGVGGDGSGWSRGKDPRSDEIVSQFVSRANAALLLELKLGDVDRLLSEGEALAHAHGLSIPEEVQLSNSSSSSSSSSSSNKRFKANEEVEEKDLQTSRIDESTEPFEGKQCDATRTIAQDVSTALACEVALSGVPEKKRFRDGPIPSSYECTSSATSPDASADRAAGDLLVDFMRSFHRGPAVAST